MTNRITQGSIRSMTTGKTHNLNAITGPVAPPAVLEKGPTAEAAPLPLFIAVPHSGRYYPDYFIAQSRLDLRGLRTSEDAYIDILSEQATGIGISQVIATHGRSYLDPNRDSRELDANMFSPALTNKQLERSIRVKAGLGCIPATVGPDMPIYDTPLPSDEAKKRLDAAYYPYHAAISRHIDARLKQFGQAIMIDLHSMPALDTNSHNSAPDIVLGDCWSRSCSRDLTNLAESIFRQDGFHVRRNIPYSGGYACQHYGQPNNGIEVLQIEISRALYMDEKTLIPLEQGFQRLEATLGRLMTHLTHTHTRLSPAAE